LQVTADAADGLHDLFKTARQALQEHKRANPLDPRVEEWEEPLDAWSQDLPKEPQE
jgi:hypothetical protein